MSFIRTIRARSRLRDAARGTLAALLALAGASLAGCATPPTSPVVFEVRDAADRPVEGASIHVVPSNATHPFRVSDYLTELAEIPPPVRTDANGLARTTAYADRPNRVVVRTPELGADGLFFPGHPAADGPSGWTTLPVGLEPRVKVRAWPGTRAPERRKTVETGAAASGATSGDRIGR